MIASTKKHARLHTQGTWLITLHWFLIS